MAPLLALLIAAECTPLVLASDAEMRTLVTDIEHLSVTREKRERIESFLGTRALAADNAAQIAATLPAGTDRHDVALALFPYVVDKDNWPTPQGSGLPARFGLVQRSERMMIEDGRAVLVVGASTGYIPPIVCLALEPMSPKAFAALEQLLGRESESRRRLSLLRKSQRNFVFSREQFKRLMDLLRYREEQADAESWLRVLSTEIFTFQR